MTDKKFTQEEVVKALECCISHVWCKDECPYSEKDECIRKIKEDALDLINYLTTTNKNHEATIKRADELIDTLKAEIERLKDYNENLLTANTALSNEILDIKTEAIKEFAERLKTKVEDIPWCEYHLVHTEIDNLVKEKTEVR